MVTTNINLTTRRYNGRQGETPNLIGIHTMEAPESLQTAENVANYFKTVNASSHWCVDGDSRVRVVNDEDAAWTLPPINNRSLNIEIAGYARQSADDWADEFSINALEIAALCVAEWHVKYGIEIRHLSAAEISAHEHGLAGHVDVNAVYKKSSHWDPGPYFPWAYFLGRCRAQAELLGAPSTGPTPSIPVVSWNNAGFSQAYIMNVQRMLNRLGYKLNEDGVRGPLTIAAVTGFQSRNGLVPDGLPGPLTLAKLEARVISTEPTPVTKKNCTSVQLVVHAVADNIWGADTDKRCEAVRSASAWIGGKFPYGVKFVQGCVGAVQDGSWGPKSIHAHDVTVFALQRALYAMGFNPGIPDGMWGQNTDNAYQAARAACRV